jgi:hypothetical protein
VAGFLSWEISPLQGNYHHMGITEMRKNIHILGGNYSSTLKMEAIRSSETSGTTLRTTRRHIPEDDTLQNHRCENLKSYIVFLYGEATHQQIRRLMIPVFKKLKIA